MKAFVKSAITYASLTTIAVLLQAAAYSAAQAQFGEVIVTAQKRAENAQDIPVAVSAYSGQFLEDTGSVDIFDLAQYSPALYLTQSQTATQTTVLIRGVGTSAQNAGLEPSVGVFVDGVYRARAGSTIYDFMDIERIEVLRGPQGTLFGKNTSSGAISIVSKRPSYEFGGAAEVSVGNLDLFSGKGTLTGPIVDGILAARATGYYTSRDGYIENIVDGTNLNDRDRWGIRGQILFDPNENWEIIVSGDYSEANELCCAAPTFVNGPSDGLVTLLGGTVLPGSDFFNRQTTLNDNPISNTEDGGFSLEINWSVAGHTVTSITGYRMYDFLGQYDSDFTNLDLIPISGTIWDQNAWTQELRIANDESNRIRYVAGFYYYSQSLDTIGRVRFGADSNAYFDAALGFGGLASLLDLFPNGGGSTDFFEQDHESFAFFGQATWDITNNLSVTGGLRYTNEKKDLTSVLEEIPDGGTFFPLLDPMTLAPVIDPVTMMPILLNTFSMFPPTNPLPDFTSSLSDDEVTGTAKIQYFWNDDTMTYVSYSRGYKSGGTNVSRVFAPLPFTFQPEVANSYEVGVKTEFFDNRVRVNAAGFYMGVNNFQDNTFVGTGFALQNAGKIESHGIEIEATALPMEGLTLESAITYQKAKFASFLSGPCQFGEVSNGVIPSTCDRSGDRVPNVPEWTLHGAATYEHSIGPVMGYLRGEATYWSDQITDTNNDPRKLQSGYTLVNGRLGIRSDDGRMDISVWAKNIFNEDYIYIAFDGVVQDGKLYAYPNEPRTFGVTLRTQF